MLIQVALAVPLFRHFDYLPIDSELPVIGARVLVPFGTQKLVGIVIGHIDAAQSEVPKNKLKAILNVIDDAPIFDAALLSLANWLSNYYHYPLGDVLSVMLPKLLRQGYMLTLARRCQRRIIVLGKYSTCSASLRMSNPPSLLTQSWI